MYVHVCLRAPQDTAKQYKLELVQDLKKSSSGPNLVLTIPLAAPGRPSAYCLHPVPHSLRALAPFEL